MSKHTAFQWYMQEYNKLANLCDTMSFDEGFRRFDELIQQAKEMEKEQIKDAYFHGSEDLNFRKRSPTKYYNETYGGNKWNNKQQ